MFILRFLKKLKGLTNNKSNRNHSKWGLSTRKKFINSPKNNVKFKNAAAKKVLSKVNKKSIFTFIRTLYIKVSRRFKKAILTKASSRLKIFNYLFMLNRIWPFILIISIFIGWYMIKYKKISKGRLFLIFASMGFVVLKILLYIVCFDVIYSLEGQPGDDDGSNEPTFFYFYSSYLMIVELILIGFIIDTLIINEILNIINKRPELPKNNIKLYYDQPNNDYKDKEKSSLKIFKIDLKKRNNNRNINVLKAHLIHIFSFFRLLVGIFLYLIFSSIINFPFLIDNNITKIIMLSYVIAFVVFPFLIYLILLIYNASVYFNKISKYILDKIKNLLYSPFRCCFK